MVSLEDIHRQCVTLYQNLEKLSAAEKKQKPSAHFGERYNTLLSQAKNALNDQEPSHWPPEIETTPVNHIGPKICQATYVEIKIYAKQVADRLSPHIEPIGGFSMG